MDTLVALKRRIELATQKDVLLGMFLESSLDNVAKVQGAERADAVRREVTGKKSVVSFFRYPVADLLKIIELGIPPGQSDFAAAVQDFGRAGVRYFFDSPVGKTMTMLASTNPHRLISSAASGYKAVSSFGERAYQNTGERSAQMVFKGDLLGPSWHHGVFVQALEAVCSVKPQIAVSDLDQAATDFILSVTW
jgi:uncharacterized protein (TIGR02265 family)